MITFKEFIVEILSSPYEYELRIYDELGEATFTTNDDHEVEVGFDVTNFYSDDNKKILYTMVDVAFDRDGDYVMTGQGDAHRIFATVLAITKEYVGKTKPDMLFFSSRKSDNGRTSFYKALIKRFGPAAGYETKKLHNIAPALDNWIQRRQKMYPKEEIMYVVRSNLK